MNDSKTRLKLYEALELRSELDARIRTIQDCLPEARKNRNRFFSLREEGNRRPSPDFDLGTAREQMKRLELRRRKLNVAIQQVNFQHRIEHEGESLTLSEALEVRKRLNEAIGELHEQLVDSAWQRVIYKGGSGHRRGERSLLHGVLRPPGVGEAGVSLAQPRVTSRLVRSGGRFPGRLNSI